MACSSCGSKIANDTQIKTEVKKIVENVPASKIKIVIKEIRPSNG